MKQGLKAASLIASALAAAVAFNAPAGATDMVEKPSKKNAWMQATRAGPPEDCIPITSIRSTRVRSDEVIDFYMAGRKVYRNQLPQRCSGLGFEQKFSYKTSLSKLCSTDIITVLNGPGISRGASCGLGQFVPVTGAGR